MASNVGYGDWVDAADVFIGMALIIKHTPMAGPPLQAAKQVLLISLKRDPLLMTTKRRRPSSMPCFGTEAWKNLAVHVVIFSGLPNTIPTPAVSESDGVE